ncbi:MAG TPA: hypothetical protein VIH90_05125 [Candidatus Saccharimonadales bacterium]
MLHSHKHLQKIQKRKNKKPADIIIIIASVIYPLTTLPGFEANGGNDKALMTQEFKYHLVRKCLGTSGLLSEGHIRFSPDANSIQDNGIAGDYGKEDANIDGAYNDNRGNILLNNPLVIQVDNKDTVSSNWYIFGLPNGQEVFVNRNALVTDNFSCHQAATPNTELGTVTERS